MARISRKKGKQEQVSTFPALYAYHTALYVRLSLEEQSGGTTFKIQNQRELLMQYIREKPEHRLVDIYCDNGCTGTNFDRPEWQRLMGDVKAGKVNCIIVKDLSRLGRNYIEAGNYLEKVFPLLGLRFIAVSDGYDSEKLAPGESGLMLPLKNIINASYAKDLSGKISSARHIQRSRGEYTGSGVPYGYVRDAKKKGRFVVKEEEAAVVRKIFDMLGEGSSYSEIAGELNRMQIPSPKGKMWRYQSIREMTANEVYLGKMVQGKRCMAGQDIAVVENAHEAIITEETFARAKAHREKISFHRNCVKEEFLFQGMLKAANSGLTLSKTRYWKQNGQLMVKAYRSPKASDKTGGDLKIITIREEVLTSAVKKLLCQYLAVLEDARLFLRQESIQRENDTRLKHMENALQNLQKEMNRKKELLSDSYQDMAESLLTPQDFKQIQKQYKEDIVKLQGRAKEKEKEVEDYRHLTGLENPYIFLLEKFGKSQKITKDLLAMLIAKIVVQGSTEIQIHFSFEDEFRNLCPFIKGEELWKYEK